MNLAAYTSGFDDLQVKTFEAATNAFIPSNAASAKSDGLEVKASCAPARRPPYRARSPTTTPSMVPIRERTAFTQTAWRRQPTASKISAVPALRVLPNGRPEADQLLGKGMRVLADASVRSPRGTYLEENLNPRSYHESFPKTDLRLGLASADERWPLAVIGRNLTSEWTASLSFGTQFVPSFQSFVVDPCWVVSIQLGLKY